MSRQRTQHYLELIVNITNILASILYLYAFIKQNVVIAKCVFYWVLVSAGFQATWFLTGELKSELRLVHFFIAFLYIYLDGIVVSFIQLSSIIARFSVEHYAALEEWDVWELREYTDSKLAQDDEDDEEGQRTESGSPKPGNPLAHHSKVVECGSPGFWNNQGVEWNKSVDFQTASWKSQEHQSALKEQRMYSAWINHKLAGWAN